MIIGVASVILVGSAIDAISAYTPRRARRRPLESESDTVVAQVAGAGGLTCKEYLTKLQFNRPITLDEDRYLQSMNGDTTYVFALIATNFA